MFAAVDYSLALSAYHISSALCLCSPSSPSSLVELIFSETLAAFRHSLAMTSSPVPPQAHYHAIEPPLVSSARSPKLACPLALVPSATERMASSSATGSQPSSCARLDDSTRYTPAS